MTVDKILEIAGFLIGLLYLWWEYHADWKLWYASMVMPAISMWIYFSKGIYADFAINIYYLAIAVYGYIVWTRGRGNKTEEAPNEHPITNTPLPVLGACTAVALALWAGIYIILKDFTDSTVPIPDAFTTAMSIVGMWMLARKYLQQWIVWIIVDAVCTCLYFYKGLPLYSLLYAIYTVIAFFGYRKWRKVMLRQAQEHNS